MDQTGRLACEVCPFGFEERCGKRGDGFAECHHVVALGDPDPDLRVGDSPAPTATA
jgi:predicted HNH restriction endonuclease